MKIEFTKHILEDKIPLLQNHGFEISKELVKEIIKNPDNLDKESDFPRLIASREVDESHILRVVYKIDEKNGIIKAITVYPAEKGRYY